MAEAKLHTAVDILHRCRTFAQHEKRLVKHRQQDTVDHEAGRILRHHRNFTDRLGKVAGHLRGLVAGRQAADHFNQPH